MLTAIIVDDEQNSIDTLRFLVDTYCNDRVKIIGTAESVQEGIEKIKIFNPDIVFLDVQIQEELGFELLLKIEKINFSIIFTTAYDKYALHAIKFSAIDYLLKPIDVIDLTNAIDKVSIKSGIDYAQYDNYIKNIRINNLDNMKMAISSIDGLVFIHVNQIIFCKSEKGYTVFYNTDGSKIVSTKNLKYFEEILIEYHFFRIHNSYLINLKEIKKYNKGDGGVVMMSNNVEIDVSKRRKMAFLAAVLK